MDTSRINEKLHCFIRIEEKMENNNYENNNQRNHMPEEPENRNHNRNNHNNQGNNGNNSPKPGGFWTFLFIGSIFLFFIFMMFRTMMPSDVNVIEYSEFVRMIENGEVEEVMIGNDRITIVPKRKRANQPIILFCLREQIIYIRVRWKKMRH